MSIRFVSWLTGLSAKTNATLAGTEEMYINDGGTSKKVLVSALSSPGSTPAAQSAIITAAQVLVAAQFGAR